MEAGFVWLHATEAKVKNAGRIRFIGHYYTTLFLNQAMAAPTQPGYEFIAHLRLTLGMPFEVGDTPRGRHRIVSISGGAVAGPHLTGTVLPGGADWQ